MESPEQRDNFLFNRKEVKLKVFDLDSPPNKENAKKIISEKFSAPEDNIYINKIETKFGSREFVIIAEIYSSKSEKDRVNFRNKKQRKKSASK